MEAVGPSLSGWVWGIRRVRSGCPFPYSFAWCHPAHCQRTVSRPAALRVSVLERAAHAHPRPGQGASRAPGLRPLHTAAAATPATSSSPGPALRALRQDLHRRVRERQRRHLHHDYACTRRQKYGPKACRNERFPREKLEHVVLQAARRPIPRRPLDPGGARRRTARGGAGLAPSSRKRLDSIRAEIIRAEQPLERSYEAFEQGKLSRLRLVTPALRNVRKSGPTGTPFKLVRTN